MTKCLKCGGTDIVRGKIKGPERLVADSFFQPDYLRPLALAATSQKGSRLAPEAYACLGCGFVSAQVDPKELRDFTEKYCKQVR
ncbi:hypothetical protein SBV1_900004 [Verrucomicrobia bacterium]|nr:hypothetical protein SBV1_900004 [Verrucomicrobiota bacterium]